MPDQPLVEPSEIVGSTAELARDRPRRIATQAAIRAGKIVDVPCDVDRSFEVDTPSEISYAQCPFYRPVEAISLNLPK